MKCRSLSRFLLSTHADESRAADAAWLASCATNHLMYVELSGPSCCLISLLDMLTLPWLSCNTVVVSDVENKRRQLIKKL